MTFNTEVTKMKEIMTETGFKPCYKWMTFNTQNIAPGPPTEIGFKPCYKWMTFNTLENSKRYT